MNDHHVPRRERPQFERRGEVEMIEPARNARLMAPDPLRRPALERRPRGEYRDGCKGQRAPDVRRLPFGQGVDADRRLKARG